MTGSKLAVALSTLAVVGVTITYVAVDDLETRTEAAAARASVPARPAVAPPTAETDEPAVIEIADGNDADLEARVEALETGARRRRDRGPSRGPALAGPKQIAEALGLTEAQQEQMHDIFGRQRERYDALLETPNAEGVTPSEFLEPYQEQYKEGFDKQDFRAVQEAMQAMMKWWDWPMPGTNETYREASDRYLREAVEEFRAVLTEKQRELYADGFHMGSFAVPVETGGESMGITVVAPGGK